MAEETAEERELKSLKAREIANRLGMVLLFEFKGVPLSIAAQASIDLAVRLVLMSQQQGGKPQDVPQAIDAVIATLEGMKSAALASPALESVPSS